MPAGELAGLIRRREVSAAAVVRAHLERIGEVNGELRAVVQLRAEGAIAEAREKDRAVARGGGLPPLHGVPFTVKDWIETNDLPCAGDVEERRAHVPKHDATAVARLRAAGAILLGKTKPGLRDVPYPRARNPHDLGRSAGGSSGGEAAIVAAGGSPLGLGSDSGGSLRWPAHCCGVATIRPTAGRVPNTGHFPRINPMADPRTVIGPIARTVADLELALAVIAGPDGRDASTVPVPLGRSKEVAPGRLRVASFTTFEGAEPSPAVIAAVERAASALRTAGADVFEATPPRLEEALPLTKAYWARPESGSWMEWDSPRMSVLGADEVERSLFEWDRFRRAMLGFMRDVELVLCPVASDVAPPFDDPVPVETWSYMLPFSLSNNPVAVVIAGEAGGLPVGVQLAGRPWEDHVALAAAAVVEAACTAALTPQPPLPTSRERGSDVP
jgi:amidase